MKIPKPKGLLFPIGGGEDRAHEKKVLKRVIAESKKKHPKICVITLATEAPRETTAEYKKAFKELDIHEISFLHYDIRVEADSPEHLKMVQNCDIVFFSGGDQLKLCSLIGGTELVKTIKARYYDEAHFVVAGTSAGATAMSSTMIVSGSSEEALIKGQLELANGLDLISEVFIDTHFTQRGRFGRLVQTLACNPGILGIGLGEDTAVLVKDLDLEVIGTGLVVIADGRCIEYTDMPDIEKGTPITVEGIKVHVLGPGKHFSISDRKLIHEHLKEPTS
jgi:cyanophycinase